MRSKTLLIGVMGIVIGVLLSTAVVFAGTFPGPGSGPGDAGSQLFTLQQVYDRLNTGAAGTKMTAFTEPSSGPGSTMRTLDEIMAKAPVADNINGATVLDVKGGKWFWGLTNGQWGLQMGVDFYPADVPKTGQTTSYVTRDDGDLEIGVAWPSPRFTDLGDGTVIDNLTGLMWLKNANAGNDCAGPDTGTETWATALASAAACNAGAGYAGHTDWRLPNVREQHSLINYGSSPALPSGHPFTGVLLNYYWASTTAADNPTLAWGVDLSVGIVNRDSKTATYLVWPVRGGQ